MKATHPKPTRLASTVAAIFISLGRALRAPYLMQLPCQTLPAGLYTKNGLFVHQLVARSRPERLYSVNLWKHV